MVGKLEIDMRQLGHATHDTRGPAARELQLTHMHSLCPVPLTYAVATRLSCNSQLLAIVVAIGGAVDVLIS